MIVPSDFKMPYCWLYLSFFTTCCLSWPTNYKQLVENTYISPGKFSELTDPYSNPWEVAEDPYAYEPIQADYYSEPQLSEVLAEMIQDYEEGFKPKSVYGKVILEKPETELEELKELGLKNRNEKRDKLAVLATSTTTVRPTLSAAPSQPPVLNFNEQVVAETKKVNPLYGQKEVPLLRPPNKVKPEESTTITLTQRSSETKLSPYDKLRKLVSIEDALKKQGNDWNQGGSYRQVKRNIVADENSLTSQLDNLKKMLH